MRCGGARILDLTESNPTRAGFEYPPEIVRAFEDPRCWSTSLRPPERPRRAKRWRFTTRRAASAWKRSASCSRLAPAKLMPGFSNCYATPATTCWFRGLRIRYSSFWRTWNPSRCAHTRWSTMAAGPSIWTSLAAAVTERTRAVVLVNPNNPTGSYVKRAELETLSRLCAQRRVALISDEVFSDYALGEARTRSASPRWWASRNAWHSP